MFHAMGNSTSTNRHKVFNKKNRTSGLKVSNKSTVISQNDNKTRSILTTRVVSNNESFAWNFIIQSWEGRCCRFGVINPETRAQGCIWNKPNAICVCISSGCWTQLWGSRMDVNSNKISPSRFENGHRVGIRIENKNNICYATWYHNNKPIENAINIPTSFKRAAIFVEVCGPITISATDINIGDNDSNIAENENAKLYENKTELDTRTNLLISGYIMRYIKKTIVPKDIMNIIAEWYKSFSFKIFDANKCTSGIQLQENDTMISQKDGKTRSILGTCVVNNNERALWRFNICDWGGRCCRFGIISPNTDANGSIWSQPNAICMCIYPSCWKRLWGACNHGVSTTAFVDGQTVAIEIENRNKICYVTWYHNDKPIANATNIATSLEKACIFFELCGAVKVSLIDFDFRCLQPKNIEFKTRLKLLSFDDKVELLVCRYVANNYGDVVPKEIIWIIMDIYKILCTKTFNKSKYTKGMQLYENDSIISQNDDITRSILSTQIVGSNESFYWKFKIEEWRGACCRFGIISSDTTANGSIWSQPNAICMCIHPSCWKRLWGANRNSVNPPKFKNGETVSIEIQNKNDTFYTTWYHNDIQIENAINIKTSLKKACLFFELCGAVKVTLIHQLNCSYK